MSLETISRELTVLFRILDCSLGSQSELSSRRVVAISHLMVQHDMPYGELIKTPLSFKTRFITYTQGRNTKLVNNLPYYCFVIIGMYHKTESPFLCLEPAAPN